MAAPPPASSINQSASLDGCDKPTTRTAAYPFNDPKADFIIRSSDKIHFYIHKSLLSIVSPVFEDMLTRPQKIYDDRPSLHVNDDKSHLLCLLSWCDPRSNKRKPTLDSLTMTLTMAKKYGVDQMFTNAQKDLLAFCSVGSQSLDVYAIAIRFRLDHVVQKAAKATLQLSLAREKSPHLNHISAFAIQNLHNYHFTCKKVTRDLLGSESWTENMKEAASYLASRGESQETLHVHGVECFSLKRVSVVGGGALWLSTTKTARWWSDYVELMMYFLNDRPSCSLHPSSLEGLQEIIALDECKQCRKKGYERLVTVSKYLSKQIDETVSKVPFKVEY